MLARRRKWIVAASVMLAVSLCLAAGIAALTSYRRITNCYDGRPPLRSIEVTIDEHQQKQLIEQFREFADKNDLKFRIVYYTPDRRQFLIELTRKDTEVIARNPFGPGEFRVGFYNNDCIRPTVARDLDGLVSQLKSLIVEIPGATFSETKGE